MCFKTLKFFIKKPKREHFHSFKEFIISNLFSTKTKISLKSFASHLRLRQWALPCPFATENLKKFPFVLGKKNWNLEMWEESLSYCSRLMCNFTNTGCPKSSFFYFISLYFSTIGLGKEIVSTKVVSFNIIHYFHNFCAIFWLEYSICLLPRQRCECASIFFSHIFFVFHSPNCSNSFLVFREYHER